MKCIKNKRVMIVGASGLLGKNFVQYYLDNGCEVVATFQTHNILQTSPNLIPLKLDLLNDQAIHDVLKLYHPELIVHCAGMTNVDLCETNSNLAYKCNSESVRVFSKYAGLNSITFVYISTDHLFSGEEKYYTETSKTAPINVYGKSKLLGEEVSLTENPKALVIRTNFFSKGLPWRHSFTDWIWNNISQGKSLNLFMDAYFTPIESFTLVSVVNQLISKEAHGIYNVCSYERISKFDFSIKFCEYFKLDSSLICPVSINSIDLQAPRPKDISLSPKKTEDFLGIKAPDMEQNFKYIENDYI